MPDGRHSTIGKGTVDVEGYMADVYLLKRTEPSQLIESLQYAPKISQATEFTHV